MGKKKEIKEYEIKGRKLVCPICQGSNFFTRKTLMNTLGLTFFNLDFANKEADNYICDNCNYVMWFLNDRS